MKIFVAGTSGAIGRPLIAELIRQGHTVTGMTSSEAGAKKIVEQGAAAELANAFDAPSVERALRRAEPEIVIDQLTALPKDPADLHRYFSMGLTPGITGKAQSRSRFGDNNFRLL